MATPNIISISLRRTARRTLSIPQIIYVKNSLYARSYADTRPDHIVPDAAHTLVATEKMEKPQEPAPDDCCGRGCAECVWTVYWNDLKEYEAKVAALKGQPPPHDPFEELEKRLHKN